MLVTIQLKVIKREWVVMSSRYIACLLLIIQSFSLDAVVKGSETSLSVEQNVVFPSADTDNTMLGFGWFKNGFSFEDSLTTCTFNSVFPVSGIINLNGGILHLIQDLVFRNDTTLAGLGTIMGNNKVICLCPSITGLPSSGGTLENVALVCNGDVDVYGALTFKGSCFFCGQKNSVVRLRPGGSITVDCNSNLDVCHMQLTGTSVFCADDSSRLIIDDVRWKLPGEMRFNKGSILFKNDVGIIGAQSFYYSSSQTSTIDSNSQLTFNDGMTVYMGRYPQTLNSPLAFTDKTSVCKFDNCSLVIAASGMQFTKGTMILDRGISFDVLSTTSQLGLMLGNGNAADDVVLRLTPGCAVTHNSGYWVYNNGAPNGLQSASITSRLVRGTASRIYIAENIDIGNFTVQLVPGIVMPMEVAPNKTVLYKKARINLPDVDFEMTAQQVNYYTYLLGGSNDIFFTKGTLPLYLQVLGSDNKLRGNGGLTGMIILLNGASTLTCGINGFVNNLIMLNNGTLSLDANLDLLSSANIVGPGTCNVNSNKLVFNGGTLTASTPIKWLGSNGFVHFNAKVDLTSTWTISGKCTIDGNNNRLILGVGGEIVIDSGSELVLKNIEIHGLKNNNIRCLDALGRIAFVNSAWYLDDNYTFTIGSLKFFRNNTIAGPHTFSYESAFTSTVRSDAKLVIGDEVTLSIGRNNGVEPLEFEDNSSTMMLDNSKFYVRSPGLRLTKGTLVSERDVEIDIVSTSTANGLIFGDGTSAGDMRLVMSPGSTVRYPQGHATFNVTSGDGIKSKSKTAELIRGAQSVFHLMQNLSLADITVDVHAASSLTIEAGKVLNYSNGRIVLPQGIFDLTGIRYNNYTTLLNGNGKIVLINGSLPLATLVAGTGNTIEGVGNVSGPIILQDNNAQLTCGVGGHILSNITLNGGTLILANDLKLANAVMPVGNGRILMGTRNLDLGTTGFIWSGNIWWSMAGATINLRSSIDLRGTWTFNGSGEIKAHGQTIDFQNGGKIVIEPASTLILHGVYLENITDGSIVCCGDDSVLILDDVTWGQQADTRFTFTVGALVVKNSVNIYGDNAIFAYQTNQVSTISNDAYLTMDANVTFSYDPIGGGSSLLEFGPTGRLVLKNATMHITCTGLELFSGGIVIKGDSWFVAETRETVNEEGDKTVVDVGITLGDGESSANDCVCSISIGSSLRLASGSLTYNNLSPASWFMESNSSLFRIPRDVRFVLNQLLDLGSGQLIMHEKANIEIAEGREITGAVFISRGDV